MEKELNLESEFKMGAGQAEAVEKLVAGLSRGLSYQTLLGVTGSGKTFAIANIAQKLQRPAIVLAPNKTLAAQLYGELKGFSLITQSNILCLTMTIISRKHMYQHPILT